VLGKFIGKIVIPVSVQKLKKKDLEYERRLGLGSSGMVYAARYRNQIVAVKEFYTARNESSELGQIFFLGMEIMSTLSHPNVVKLLGAVVESPYLCLVLDHAGKGDLKQYLMVNRTSDWRTYKKDVALGIARGMKYLHSRTKPIMHLDLKTSNCLITDELEVKISDFGTARYWTGGGNPHDNQTGVEEGLVGSQFYMAPEIINGDKCTVMSDVYSFGSVLASIGMGGNLKSLFSMTWKRR